MTHVSEFETTTHWRSALQITENGASLIKQIGLDRSWKKEAGFSYQLNNPVAFRFETQLWNRGRYVGRTRRSLVSRDGLLSLVYRILLRLPTLLPIMWPCLQMIGLGVPIRFGAPDTAQETHGRS